MNEPEIDSAARPSVTASIRRGVAEIGKTLFLAAVVFVAARTLILPYEVEGASMKPNLHGGERVLVNRSVYLHVDLNRFLNWLPGVEREGEAVFYPFHMPERGDIVVLQPPVRDATKPYIKRVIGLPGETITFRDGYVYVDGRRLEEPYLKAANTTCDEQEGCHLGRIPEGHVYVLGDNRTGSSDSRRFGVVPIDDIIGKAWFTNWPLDDLGLVPHQEYDE